MAGIGRKIGAHLFDLAQFGQITKGQDKIAVAGFGRQMGGQNVKMALGVTGEHKFRMLHFAIARRNRIKGIQQNRITDKAGQVIAGFQIMKQGFCRLVKAGDGALAIDHNDRVGQMVENFGIGAGLCF